MLRRCWIEQPRKRPWPQIPAKQNGTEIRWRVNPDVGVVGYPAVSVFVSNDVLNRSSAEGNVLSLDLCSLTPVAQGCL